MHVHRPSINNLVEFDKILHEASWEIAKLSLLEESFPKSRSLGQTNEEPSSLLSEVYQAWTEASCIDPTKLVDFAQGELLVKVACPSPVVHQHLVYMTSLNLLCQY